MRAGLDLHAESESPPIVVCNAAASPSGAVFVKRGHLGVEAAQVAFSRIGCKMIAGVALVGNNYRNYPGFAQAYGIAGGGRAWASWISSPFYASALSARHGYFDFGHSIANCSAVIIEGTYGAAGVHVQGG